MAEFVVWGVPGSPYLRSALLALEEKGADWRLAPLGMGESKSPAHLARQPFGRIPVLDHGDFRLYEAQAIQRYVDRVATGPALSPADPKAAARMDQVMNIVDWYVFPYLSAGVVFPRLIAPRFGLPTDEARIAENLPNARLCLEELSRLLGEQRYFAGDQVSLADLHLAPQLVFLDEFDQGRELAAPYANLRAWAERMVARPSLAATSWETLAESAKAA
jgi:glutathione S-transferase